MINLYGNQPTQAMQQVQGQAQRAGQGFFGSVSGAGQAAQPQVQIDQARISEAVDAWGKDIVKNWNQSGGELMNALKQDLKSMREEAVRARQENDMERYKLALQKSLFDKQMLAYGNLIDKANRHNLLNAVLYGVGQVGAGVASKQYEKKYQSQLEGELQGQKDWFSNLMDYYQYQLTPGSQMGR
jgi:hypothetical protein